MFIGYWDKRRVKKGRKGSILNYVCHTQLLTKHTAQAISKK